MRFQHKFAIVTGGSSGIGKEVATRFVAEVDPSSSSDAMPPKLGPRPSKSTPPESARSPVWATLPYRRPEKQR
jgi:hypothetical protein